MELREISLYEARMNDLPASEPGEGEVCIWYALEDNDEYKGFIEVIHNEAEVMDEIDYFIVPDELNWKQSSVALQFQHIFLFGQITKNRNF